MIVCSEIAGLLQEYNLKRKNIRKRLRELNRFESLSDRGLFEELVFCLFTPGSKAVNADKAVKKLKGRKMLYSSGKDEIALLIRGLVRFHNNKARYLVCAREFFTDKKKLRIKERLARKDPLSVREYLVGNIKGLGYKEAGHFMRNIGLGRDITILDTHVLKNLKNFNVIKDIPVSISRKLYFRTEERMRRFAKDINIPLDELDLLFWSRQTGFIFK